MADFIGKVNFLVGEAVGPGQVRVLDRVLAVDDLAMRPAGSRVVVTIRPEAISLVQDGGQFTGTIARATFLGGIVEYAVRVPGLDSIIVHDENPIMHGLREEGSTVDLELPARALHALAEE